MAASSIVEYVDETSGPVRDLMLRLLEIPAKWKQAAERGQTFASAIANSVLRTTYIKSTSSASASLQLPGNRLLRELSEVKIYQEIQKYQKDLLLVLSDLGNIRAEIREIAAEIEQKRTTVESKYKQSWPSRALSILDHPLFATVSLNQCVSFVTEFEAMFESDFTAKSLIAKDIHRTFNREVQTVYLSTWTMQPYVNQRRIQEIRDVLNDEL